MCSQTLSLSNDLQKNQINWSVISTVPIQSVNHKKYAPRIDKTMKDPAHVNVNM